jgi:hypothetical protein
MHWLNIMFGVKFAGPEIPVSNSEHMLVPQDCSQKISEHSHISFKFIEGQWD